MSYKVSDISIVFYDGSCGLCSRFIKFIIKFDKDETFYFSPLGSDVAKKHLSTQSSDTVILLQNGVEYVRSEAALLILKQLPQPISLMYIFKIVPRFFRDYLYKLVANNRHRLFKAKDQCLFPRENVRKRFI